MKLEARQTEAEERIQVEPGDLIPQMPGCCAMGDHGYTFFIPSPFVMMKAKALWQMSFQ